MELQELKSAVYAALDLFFKHDSILIRNGSSEWAIAHRLAVYLESLLPGWNVDCEYNRQGEGEDEKRNPDNKLVRPDIVLPHRTRPEPEHNLLIVEAKVEETDEDFGKLRAYTSVASGKQQFQYQYGLALSFLPRLRERWIRNGKQIE